MYKIKNLSIIIEEKVLIDSVSFNLGKGIHYIIGASGSGKTSLVNSLALLENNNTGEIKFNDIVLNSLSNNEKEEFRRNEISYVNQSVSLFKNLSVGEHLKEFAKIYHRDEKLVDELVNSFKIDKILEQKIKTLSGGQQQKVSVILGILKNSTIFILDEPTSNLDEIQAKALIKRIKAYAEDKIVLVITHDRKIIDEQATSILTIKNKKIVVENISLQNTSTKLTTDILDEKSISNFGLKMFKKSFFKSILPVVVTLISTVICFLSLTGGVIKMQNYEFNSLEEKYGDTIRNISIVSDFMEASGTGGSSSGGSGSVKQDISKIYDQYVSDSRVDFILYSFFIHNGNISGGYRGPRISIEGTKVNDFQLESSNGTPTFNKLLFGRMVDNSKNEVLVPQKILKKYDLTPEDVLGKKMTFLTNPLGKFSDCVAVGIIDTAVVVNDFVYEHEDSFIFSRNILEQQLAIKNEKIDQKSFIIRGKTLKDVVEISNELKNSDIIPLGQFEKVADIIIMGNKVNSLGIIISVLIVLFGIVLIIGFSFINIIPRKKEFAIYRINGISKLNIKKILVNEQIIIFGFELLIFLALTPVINLIAKAMYINMFSLVNLILYIFLIVLMNLIIILVNCFVSNNTNISTQLKKVTEEC